MMPAPESGTGPLRSRLAFGVLALAVGCAGAAVSGGEAASLVAAVYDDEDVEIAPLSIRCLAAGERIGLPPLNEKSKWSEENYGNRLRLGGTGPSGLLIEGTKANCDTAWSVLSEAVPLPRDVRRIRLSLRVTSARDLPGPGGAAEKHSCYAYFSDGCGKAISSVRLGLAVPRGERVRFCETVDVPAGAARIALRIGFDTPNLAAGERIVLEDIALFGLPDRPACVRRGSFVSDICEAGRVSWSAECPKGASVRFRWRAAATYTDLLARPFIGADGTENSFCDRPFEMVGKLCQYEATLLADGSGSPVLRTVRVGEREYGDWTVRQDFRPPDVLLKSASPFADPRAEMRFAIEDEASVDWESLSVEVDGEDRTGAFSREGSEIFWRRNDDGWTNGLHAAVVTVADVRGNRVRARRTVFRGRGPTAPDIRLRADGMTLVDGKPWFPIGLYSVCRREFNGNSLDRAFQDLQQAGFDFAHTYENSYEKDFLAAARRHGFRLWVKARKPDATLIDIGRHDPAILAWYLGDDTSDHETPEELQEYNACVKSVDPVRLTCQADPVFSPGTLGNGLSRYAGYVHGTDVFMPEIYPVRGEEGDLSDRICVAATIRDMKVVRRDQQRFGGGRARGCWPILQAFSGWDSWNHFPSRDAIAAMSFAAIIYGANGITWYTYGGFRGNKGVTSTPERWKNMCELASRIRELAPALAAESPRQPPTPQVISGPVDDHFGNPSVTLMLKEHAGSAYLLAVSSVAETVRVRFGGLGRNGEAKVLWEGREVALRGGTFEDEFAPLAVHVYKWNRQEGRGF